MKIICSVTNGLFSTAECLDCALGSGRPPCGYDYALLKAMYGSSEQETRAAEIHVTDLTGCARRAYYDKREPSPEYPHEMLVRWMGSGFHGMVEGSDTYMDSELVLAYDGIVGRSDIVYRDGRLVDLKFTRWMVLSNLPYGSHILQVNVYAWILGKMGREVNRLQIQYIDASGPTKCRAHKVAVRNIDGVLACPKCLTSPKGAHLGAYLIDVPLMPDWEIEQAIQTRKRNLKDALAMGFPPEREVGFLCGYCAHAARCQPELEREYRAE